MVVWADSQNAPAGIASVQRTAGRAPGIAPPVTPTDDDISVMLYTSGTTGRPKGVPRTHRAEHHAALAHLIQTGHGPGDVTLGVMPLFHTMGLRSLLASVLAAGTWVPQTNFVAEESLDLITREKVGALYLVPTIYWSLLQTGRLGEASSIRKLAYAGASMTPTLAQGLSGLLHPERFVNHFGSTETTRSRSGRTGRPSRVARAGQESSRGSVSSTHAPTPPRTRSSPMGSRDRLPSP